MGFNFLKGAEPLREGSLHFITKLPQTLSTHWLNDLIFYLPDKFVPKAYKFVEVDSRALTELRAEESLRCNKTIVGSENFQIALFTLGSETFKPSPCLCLWGLCILNYGFCKFWNNMKLKLNLNVSKSN